jgi:hypothetical protein
MNWNADGKRKRDDDGSGDDDNGSLYYDGRLGEERRRDNYSWLDDRWLDIYNKPDYDYGKNDYDQAF